MNGRDKVWSQAIVNTQPVKVLAEVSSEVERIDRVTGKNPAHAAPYQGPLGRWRSRDRRPLVVAGSHAQFRDWCRANEYPMQEFRYICTPSDLCGVYPSPVIRLGTWWTVSPALLHEIEQVALKQPTEFIKLIDGPLAGQVVALQHPAPRTYEIAQPVPFACHQTCRHDHPAASQRGTYSPVLGSDISLEAIEYQRDGTAFILYKWDGWRAPVSVW